jgi:hypothetical protein
MCLQFHVAGYDAGMFYLSLYPTIGLVNAVKDVFWDSLLSLLALPPCKYAQLCVDIETIWQRIFVLLSVQDPNRYLTLAWIDIKASAKKMDVGWLARLALEGTVAPQPSGDVFGDGLARRFAAFLVADWDGEAGAVCIRSMVPRSMVSLLYP